MFWNVKDDMTVLGIESDRENMNSTQFSLFRATRSTELGVTFVRDDRFVTAMRADKKIITKIDETTKNSFLDGIIGNVSDLTSIIKRADIVDIVIKDIGKRFLAFDLIDMIKIVESKAVSIVSIINHKITN